MKIAFTKMHGCGNDYIYLDCLEEGPAKRSILEQPCAIASAMAPRHTSVGADGLVLICRSNVADAKMRMFNLDGSEGRMCGNALRCVGKYLYDRGICHKRRLEIETLSGVKSLELLVDPAQDVVTSATVAMGVASFAARDIPLLCEGDEFIESELEAAGKLWSVTCVSMGNPHAVVFLDGANGAENLKKLELTRIGPAFERHALFPEHVNTEFVYVENNATLQMRVWERGSGETYACGTGACAAVAAAARLGICPFGVPVIVKLLGGELTIVVNKDFSVTMTGNAVEVYQGIYDWRR